jgi:hypothetical protein
MHCLLRPADRSRIRTRRTLRKGHLSAQCTHAQIKQREVRGATQLAQRVEEARRVSIAALELDTAALGIAVVPASERLTTKLPHRRKNEFRQYLVGLAAESFRLEANGPPPLPEDQLPGAPQFQDETPAALAGCATCRGHCCHHGASQHAFLGVATFRRYRSARPRLRQRGIVAAYVRHIPADSIEESCVYHGAAGCILPRQMRASICNTFHCRGLQRLEALVRNPDTRTLLIAAASERSVVRWAIYQPGVGPDMDRGLTESPPIPTTASGT